MNLAVVPARRGWRALRLSLVRGRERYALMQRQFYSGIDSNDEQLVKAIIGNYDAHEAYPYEEYLLEGLGDASQMVALDFGCGAGRMIRRLAPRFARIDGVDISPPMLDAARRWTAELQSAPKLFPTNGLDLGSIPSGTYDFLYTTIAFHHIARHDVREGLIREFFRVLKPGARVNLQMLYTTRPREQWPQHADWLDNPEGVAATNGACDVRITDRNLADVEATFRRCGFAEFSHRLAPPPHAAGDVTHWIFLKTVRDR